MAVVVHTPKRAAGEAHVGRPMARVEDRRLLTGRSRFVDDIDLDRMLHARFVRSPVAHARVGRIELGAAQRADGVEAVISGAQLELPPLVAPVTTEGAYNPPRPLLARERVRFAGEPVAVVVARSAYAAEDAAELVELELDPLPVITDPLRAPDAAPIHDHESNVAFEGWLESGDVDSALRKAAAVVTRRFVNPRYSAVPIEPRGLVAVPESGSLVLWSSTQAPHKLRAIVAELLDLDREALRVVCPDIGGGFGQKCHAYPEEIVTAWLALRLGRPVKWVEDRSENLLAASHARDQTIEIRAGVDADGRLLGIDADVVCDTGAYGVYPHGHVLEALGTPAMIPGPYRVPAYQARSRSMLTNKCPEGAYRGVGLPVSAFVHERLMDVLASELGIDRAEIRRRNLIGADEMPYTTPTNQRYDSGDYAAAFESALEAIGYVDFVRERGDGLLRGIGFASYVEYTGINSKVFTARGMIGIAGYDGAQIVAEPDGSFTVWTTVPAIGQGVATTFAQLAADELATTPDRVRVADADTGAGGIDGTGAFASRSAVSGGGAIAAAAAKLRDRLLADAGERLGVAADQLELVDGRIVGGAGAEHAIGVAELVAEAEERPYGASAQFDPPAVAFPYATHACTVAVDPDTGAVAIERYVIVEDCGRVINPVIVDGQVHGATAQGIAGTLYESMVYDEEGQLQTGSLMDYLVPTAAEIPPLEVNHMQIPAPDSPHGVKGVGEGGTLAPPGAIANAVSDALGVEFNELPLTPERVRSALSSTAPAD
jgi:carbon-monoxide dehydrogenase large subunit